MPSDNIIVGITAGPLKDFERRIQAIKSATERLQGQLDASARKMFGLSKSRMSLQQTVAYDPSTGKTVPLTPTPAPPELMKLHKLPPSKLPARQLKAIEALPEAERDAAREQAEKALHAQRERIKKANKEISALNRAEKKNLAAREQRALDELKDKYRAEGYQIVNLRTSTSDVRKQLSAVTAKFMDKFITSGLEDAQKKLRQGIRMKDPAYLNKAREILAGQWKYNEKTKKYEEVKAGLFSEEVRKAVPAKVFRKIERAFMDVEDAIKHLNMGMEQAGFGETARSSVRSARKALTLGKKYKDLARIAEGKKHIQGVLSTPDLAKYISQKKIDEYQDLYDKLDEAEKDIQTHITNNANKQAQQQSKQAAQTAKSAATKSRTELEKEFSRATRRIRNSRLRGKEGGSYIELEKGRRAYEDFISGKKGLLSIDQEEKAAVELFRTEAAQRKLVDGTIADQVKAEESYQQRLRRAISIRRHRQNLRTRRHEAQAAHQKKAAQRATSQNIMGLASAGIGLFGQAGFPLLNIAFASMSGGPFAIISAFATAIGETVRGVNALQMAAKQAADSIGFISREAKFTRAQEQGWKAVWGGMTEGSTTRAMEERMKAWQIGGNMETGWRMWSEGWERFKNIFAAPGMKTNRAYDIYEQIKRDQANAPEMLMKQRAEYVREAFQQSARIESPEAMWQRIQTAAASRSSNDERVKLELLGKIDELIAVAKDNAASAKKTVQRIEEQRKNKQADPWSDSTDTAYR